VLRARTASATHSSYAVQNTFPAFPQHAWCWGKALCLTGVNKTSGGGRARQERCRGGNTTAVAAEHYLEVRDQDFERAAKSAAVSLQNALQSELEPNAVQRGKSKKPRKIRGFRVSLRFLAGCRKGYLYPHGDSNPGLLAENQTS
jgi:hypothetical protein